MDRVSVGNSVIGVSNAHSGCFVVRHSRFQNAESQILSVGEVGHVTEIVWKIAEL
jgi:hypothetical protein